jgi:outer membrane receptor protein involved in Fe transport
MKQLLAPAILFVPAVALGQDLLDPLVVTGSRSETKLTDVPYTTSVLDEDFLRENTRRTLPPSKVSFT